MSPTVMSGVNVGVSSVIVSSNTPETMRSFCLFESFSRIIREQFAALNSPPIKGLSPSSLSRS